MNLLIRGGRLVDPASGTDALHDVAVSDGRIVGLGGAPAGFSAQRTIDATGAVVIPGLVDLAARLREPGSEYRATLQSELLAAGAGGVTTLACPPDTDPPLDEPGLVEMLKHRARTLNLAHLYPLGALTAKLAGERLTEMAELRDAGCIAFTQADAPLLDTQVLFRGLQYAATFGFAVWLRPQDRYLAKNGVAHDGEVATRLGLAAIPSVAETIALDTILRLVRITRTRVHVCRLSAAESVQMVRAAKAEGLPVTCDIAVHHLHLSDMDIGFFNPLAHLVPPLRSSADRDALRAGVADGTIDAICSDHTPVDDDAKQLPFGEAEAGATGLELLLPLTLKWAQEARVPVVQALARITSEPARVLGIDAGRVRIGGEADLCVFDPEVYSTVSADSLKSQGRNTPFLGYELPGKVRATIVGGNVVYQG